MVNESSTYIVDDAPNNNMTDGMTCRFSIIIVHRNGESIIRNCLKSVQHVRSDQDEVVVVDNGSTDDSVAIIKSQFDFVRVIENNCNNGFAAANNQAIESMRGKYCLLLNNDAMLPSSALDRFESVFMEQPKIAVIAPQLITGSGEEQRSFGYFMKPMDEVLPKSLRKKQMEVLDEIIMDVDTVIGASIVVRNSALQQVGLLDDDFFFYFEEVEWCYRFKKNGFRVVLDRSVRVVHEKGESTRLLRKEAQIEMLRSRFLYYRKVFGRNVAHALQAYRIMRLALNFMFATLFLVLTLGVHRNGRATWTKYGYQLVWILLGKPRSWGLPDKCPIGYGQVD